MVVEKQSYCGLVGVSESSLGKTGRAEGWAVWSSPPIQQILSADAAPALRRTAQRRMGGELRARYVK
jgi:hypothetical protein